MACELRHGSTFGVRAASVLACAAGLALAGCGGGSAQSHHDQGEIYLTKTHEYARAITEFQAALALEPNRPDTLYSLGRAHLLARHYREALESFNRLEVEQKDPRAALGHSETYLIRARWNVLDLAKSDTPAALYVKDLEKGMAGIESDLAAATDYCARYAKQKPDDAQAPLRQAEIELTRLRFLGQVADLYRRHAERLRDLNQPAESADSEQKRLAVVQDAVGQFQRTLTAYERASTVAPQNAEPHTRLLEAVTKTPFLERLDAAAVKAAEDRVESAAQRLLALQPNSDVALLGLAWVDRRRGRPAEARRRLDAILRTAPKHLDALHLRIQCDLQEAQYDQAIADAQKALAVRPNDQEALYGKGLAQFHTRDYAGAVTTLAPLVAPRGERPLIEAEPAMAAHILNLLGAAYLAQQNPRAAIGVYSQSLRAMHRYVPAPGADADRRGQLMDQAVLDLVSVYLATDRLTDVDDLLRRYADRMPAGLASFALARRFDHEAGQAWADGDKIRFQEVNPKALELYQKAAEERPGSYFDRYWTIQKPFRSRQYEECIAECDRIIGREEAEMKAEAYEVKMQALANLGRLDEAIRTGREGLASIPDRARTHQLMAGLYRGHGRLDLAIRQWEEAAKAAPGSIPSWNLAALYMRRAQSTVPADPNDLRAALAAARVVLNAEPDNLAMLLLSARAAARLGDLETSQKRLEEALKEGAKNPAVLHVAGEEAMFRGDLPQAEDYFQRALNSEARSILSAYPLGMVQVAQGRSKEAVKTFEEAIRGGATPARQHLGLVVSLQAAGQGDDALAACARAIESVGAEQGLENVQAMLFAGLNRPDEALAAINAAADRLKTLGQPLNEGSLRHSRALIEALRTDPAKAQRVALALNLATFYTAGAWPARALEAAESALAAVPTSVSLMQVLISRLNAVEDAAAVPNAANVARALQLAKDVAASDPKWAAAQAALAAQYERAKQTDQAQEAAVRAAVLDAENVGPRLYAARLYERYGRPDKALEQYQAAAAIPSLDRQPALAALVYNNLAFGQATRAHDVPGAAEYARKARVAVENSPALMRSPSLYGNVLDTTGWIEHLSGKSADAVKTLERANALAPFTPAITYHLGVAYEVLGDRPNAIRYLRAAIDAAGPGFEQLDDARNRLKALESGSSRPITIG